MTTWVSQFTQALWQNGLTIVPLVAAILVVLRFGSCRPATRHLLWLTALLWLVAPQQPGAWARRTLGHAAEQTRVLDISGWLSSALARYSDGAVFAKSHVGSEDPAIGLDVSAAPCYGEPAPAPDFAWSAGPAWHWPAGQSPATVPTRPSRGVLRSPLGGLEVDAPPVRRLANRVDSPHGPAVGNDRPFGGRRNDAPRSAVFQSDHPVDAPRKAHTDDASDRPPTTLARTADPSGPPIAGSIENLIESTTPPVAPSWLTLMGALPSRLASLLGEPAAPRAMVEASMTSYDAVQSEGVWQGDGSSVGGALGMGGASGAGAMARWRGMWDELYATMDEWSVALRGLWEALSRVPRIPTNVWLGGSALLLILGAGHIARFRRRVARADAADRGVREMVSSASSALGLRRVPMAYFVGGRLSPMVCHFGAPRLLLPRELWDDLDDAGRYAVIMHELAHLRRRDHWVSWFDTFVGCLFWWHPLVWWIRQRLHHEAETCCDAWVTTLLPKRRRAYAEALLRTRQYIGDHGGLIPMVGTGVLGGRAKTFARRLTMVMVDRNKPGLSLPGVLLAVCVAGVGWLAAPVLSCPKSEAKDKDCAWVGSDSTPGAAASAASCGSQGGAATAQGVAAAEVVLASANDGGEGDPVVVHASGRSHGSHAHKHKEKGRDEDDADDDDGDDDDEGDEDDADDEDEDASSRVQALERTMARLHEQIAHMEAALAQLNSMDDGREPRAPRAPRTPRAHRAPRGPLAPLPPIPPVPPVPPTPAVAPVPKPGQTWAQASPAHADAVWRKYKMGEEKLEAFYRLMSRSDVPILVRSAGDAIEIQATPAQQEVFAAFVAMIDPSEERSDAGSFDAAMRRYAELVPHGPGDCLDRCKTCKMARELQVSAGEMRERARVEVDRIRAEALGEAERARAEARREADLVRERMRAHARDARRQAQESESARDAVERELDRVREQADRLREEAERMRERAQESRERADESDRDDVRRRAFEQRVEMMERSAQALEAQAESFGEFTASLQDRTEELNRQARSLDGHANLLDERAESVDDAARSADDESHPTMAEALIAFVGEMLQSTCESMEREAFMAPEEESDAYADMREEIRAAMERAMDAADADDESPDDSADAESDDDENGDTDEDAE